ncbi:Sulfatase-like protein [Phytophthora palmivora]|uniref:Sulfatase-like protein n=1 Tax=Phytophthora palmivora TaxID=4796 RepID=A0A2P4X719_9STRA|nr:Sulfatase-like protein [Phytophthora palmivora]
MVHLDIVEEHGLKKDSQRLIKDNSPIPRRVRDHRDTDDDQLDLDLSDTLESPGTRRRRLTTEVLHIADLFTLPWFGWLFVYAFTLFCFSGSGCVAFKSLATMNGSPRDYTASFKVAVLGLGFMEDFICVTYLVRALWVLDTFKLAAIERWDLPNRELVVRVVGSLAKFTVSWILSLEVTAPFVADMLLVLTETCDSR